MRSRYEKVKPRAVFVHGAGGGGWEWAIWQRVFAAHGWRSVARDLLPVQKLKRSQLHRQVLKHLQCHMQQLRNNNPQGIQRK